MNPYIIAFLLVSVLVSFLINKYFVDLFENKKMKLNTEAKEGEIRWAPRKPPYGGVSFYVSFMFAQIAFLFIAKYIGIDLFNLKVLAIVLACSIGFFLGLIDDIYNTIPLLKSGGQFICGLIFIFSDITIHCSNMIIIDYIVTMMWVVGIMNSINMLDNIDSIVTMISISILSFVLYYISFVNIPNQYILFCSIAVLGALIGFLFLNWNPAKIYMGDTGSQFLGAFLAAATILTLWKFKEIENPGLLNMDQFILCALAFIVPIFDTTTVFYRRISNGTSPFVGGKDHTTHQIAYLGFTIKQVVLILFSFSVFSSLIGVYLLHLDWSLQVIYFTALYYLVCFTIMQIIYNKGKKMNEMKSKK